MDNLSLDEAKDKILEAITNQRWFFFENKPKVLMDKLTGILWANLDYFPYKNPKEKISNFYSTNKAVNLLKNYQIDNFFNWVIPNLKEIKKIVIDKSFPFCSGSAYCIKNNYYWICNDYGKNRLDLETFQSYLFQLCTPRGW